LKRRLDREAVDNLVTGPSIEKSIAPLRSFVAEPMRFGRMFSRRRRRPYRAADRRQRTQPRRQRRALPLAGVAANITDEKSSAGIDGYSEKALARVWKAVRFSWWMTAMLHRFPDTEGFWRPDPTGRAGLSRELESRVGIAVGKLCRVCRIRRSYAPPSLRGA